MNTPTSWPFKLMALLIVHPSERRPGLPRENAWMREYLDRLTAWIANHPDMLERRNPNGTPVIRVDCIHVDIGERWTEYSSVWSVAGARHVLGY